MNFTPLLCRGQTEVVFKLAHPIEDLEYVFESTCDYYYWDSLKSQRVLITSVPITFEFIESKEKVIPEQWRDIYGVDLDDEFTTMSIWIWKARIPTILKSTSIFIEIKVTTSGSDDLIKSVNDRLEINSSNTFLRFLRS